MNQIAIIGGTPEAAFASACLKDLGLSFDVYAPGKQLWFYRHPLVELGTLRKIDSLLHIDGEGYAEVLIGEEKCYEEKEWEGYKKPSSIPSLPKGTLTFPVVPTERIVDILWRDTTVNTTLAFSNGELKDISNLYPIVLMAIPSPEAEIWAAGNGYLRHSSAYTFTPEVLSKDDVDYLRSFLAQPARESPCFTIRNGWEDDDWYKADYISKRLILYYRQGTKELPSPMDEFTEVLPHSPGFLSLEPAENIFRVGAYSKMRWGGPETAYYDTLKIISEVEP
jgi:hypothetical protein